MYPYTAVCYLKVSLNILNLFKSLRNHIVPYYHVETPRPKRMRDASNRRRGGYKYQKQLQNRMREQERIETQDQISQALNIMGSLARSLETVLD